MFALVIGQAGLLNLFAFIERFAVFLNIGFSLVCLDNAFLQQFVGIKRTRARVLRHFAIHHRLGQERIITLVVTELAEANQIDHHIFVEGFAVIQSRLNHITYSFRIITVYMENRRFHHFGQIGAMGG